MKQHWENQNYDPSGQAKIHSVRSQNADTLLKSDNRFYVINSQEKAAKPKGIIYKTLTGIRKILVQDKGVQLKGDRYFRPSYIS